MKKHSSKLTIGEPDMEEHIEPTPLVLWCECGWAHVFKPQWDRYEGHVLPTLETVWAVWMKHLGEAI